MRAARRATFKQAKNDDEICLHTRLAAAPDKKERDSHRARPEQRPIPTYHVLILECSLQSLLKESSQRKELVPAARKEACRDGEDAMRFPTNFSSMLVFRNLIADPLSRKILSQDLLCTHSLCDFKHGAVLIAC